MPEIGFAFTLHKILYIINIYKKIKLIYFFKQIKETEYFFSVIYNLKFLDF